MIDAILALSPNHDERPEGCPVRFVVLHYTGMESGEAALARLRDPQAKVSAHYLIEEDGRLFALVAEDSRAWHAGVSAWGDVVGLNDVSIGVELVNPGHEWGYRPFPEPQLETLRRLLADVGARHRLRPAAFLAHSDVAPARKDDPGELFPWRRFAEAGFGLWPEDWQYERPDEGAARALLRLIGYRLDQPGTELRHAVRAFQRRFRPEACDGALDPATMGLIRTVSALPWRGTRAT